MRKENVSVGIEAEKLRALRFYLDKLGTTPQAELEKCAQELYRKNVPGPTRSYIDSICAEDEEQAGGRAGRTGGTARQ